MDSSVADRIEKQIEILAPNSRVWKALTDYQEFGKWFRVNLRAPFLPGQATGGNITYEGYEHLEMELVVQTVEPEHRFAFNWHPYAIDPKVDYSQETPTLVEFTLHPFDDRTKVIVYESGFNAIPDDRREEAYRMNESGWAEQLRNLKAYLEDRRHR